MGFALPRAGQTRPRLRATFTRPAAPPRPLPPRPLAPRPFHTRHRLASVVSCHFRLPFEFIIARFLENSQVLFSCKNVSLMSLFLFFGALLRGVISVMNHCEHKRTNRSRPFQPFHISEWERLGFSAVERPFLDPQNRSLLIRFQFNRTGPHLVPVEQNQRVSVV